MGYVTQAPAVDILEFLASLAGADRPYLWITDRTSPLAADGGRVLRVATLAPREGALDPRRLGDLRAVAAGFVAEGGSGLVVVDCLENLVLHNGAERVLRALADLHDEVTMKGGSLVVLVDVRAANPRLVAWLERELDALPSAESAARQASLLST